MLYFFRLLYHFSIKYLQIVTHHQIVLFGNRLAEEHFSLVHSRHVRECGHDLLFKNVFRGNQQRNRGGG